jgi:hypothetical protein
MVEFVPFPKIPRLRRNVVVTEKLDGTNAAVQIVRGDHSADPAVLSVITDGAEFFSMFAQSRTRIISPGKETDNFGFAAWVVDNSSELYMLGEGVHYGEWWGRGIQRHYDLPDRRFSLFNAGRWVDGVRPACCGVVPILYHGPLDDAQIEGTLTNLSVNGSVAAPGFMKPEGIIVYHTASHSMFKRTIDKDEAPKGMAA